MTDIVDPSAIPDWQKKLAAMTKVTVANERPPGSMFGTKSGVLTYNKLAIPNNTMDVVITGAIFENAYYPDAYDPENITPPVCYAFGVPDEDGTVVMIPHPSAHIRQAETCDLCAFSKFGSATTGTKKGKACRPLRRLSVLPAPSVASVEGIKKAAVGFVRLAVYSGMEWAKYVRELSVQKRSPYTVVTRMKLVPDTKAQFKFLFEALADITDDGVLEALVTRHDYDVNDMVEPYPAMPAEAAPAPQPAGAFSAPQM